MSKFVYVFTHEAYEDMLKKGHTFLREDPKNQIWVFLNKDPENLEFQAEYQVVLSDVLTF